MAAGGALGTSELHARFCLGRNRIIMAMAKSQAMNISDNFVARVPVSRRYGACGYYPMASISQRANVCPEGFRPCRDLDVIVA